MVLGVVSILGTYWIVRHVLANPRPLHPVYFVNEKTGECTLGPADKFPPMAGKDGDLVWAFYFSCDGGRTRQLGYLTKYSAEAKARLEAAATRHGGRPTSEDYHAELGEMYVRSPKPESAWHKSQSPEGQAVVAEVHGPAGQEWNYMPLTAEGDGH